MDLQHPYDALLVVSFGGPEGPDEVMPFLENVLRGRNVPRERMLEVAQHYYEFGGISPINEQSRQLIAALERELAEHGPKLPIYWGNRNWRPYLRDAIQQMADDGVQRALAFVTSAYSTYSSCRQYLEDIARAREEVGQNAPRVDKLRAFFNHPGFIEPQIESARNFLGKIRPEMRSASLLLFTAHSIPLAMAENSRYVSQLEEACRLVAEGTDHQNWKLAYQSRSGPPHQPWLEPDVRDFVAAEHTKGSLQDLVVLPIGFLSDHLEVIYDLDTELRALCDQLGIRMERAATAGTHPRFVRMIRELIAERMSNAPIRLALGSMGPSHDVCPDDCCQCMPSMPRIERLLGRGH